MPPTTRADLEQGDHIDHIDDAFDGDKPFEGDKPLDAGSGGPGEGAGSDGGDGDDGTGDEGGRSSSSSAARAFFDWVVVVGVALLVALLVKTFLLAHFIVDGQSMNATLHPNDRVFVNKLSYRLHDPGRGDVVVLHEVRGASERDLIKRVIALPGETIEIEDCNVYIDGFRLDEPYLTDEVVDNRSWCSYAPTTIPDDHVFVMGDNRPASADSRSIGPVAFDDLVGRAFVVFWPSSNMSWL